MNLKCFQTAHKARPKSGRNKGVTLIELAFVIGIIAVILVGVMGVYNTVQRSQTLSDVTTDVAVIRQAVSTWARGGPITYSAADIDRGFTSLTDWGQLAGFLPGDLGELARRGGDDRVLTAANSWECTYELEFYEDDPYRWSLKIDRLPTDVMNALANSLREGVVADQGEGDTLQRGLERNDGNEGENNSSLKLTYRH